MGAATSFSDRRHRCLAAAAVCITAAPTVYPLVLAAAASHGRRRPAPQGRVVERRFLVLIPAHDEEDVIAQTLQSLREVDYPFDQLRTVVIADNCSDRTAEIASRAGADVLVRTDSARRGKGQALAWALDVLADEVHWSDAVVFLDADCRASVNFLQALETRLAAGASAAQVHYAVANPDESWAAALRWGAFALLNFVRPLGRSVLGLSCGISGTGFALSSDLLARHPWAAFSLSEDHEYHLRLIAAGERVAFVPEASVTSPMPTTLAGSKQQNLRWEGGKWELLRQWAPTLLAAGVRGQPRLLLAALELLLPPQSLLAAWSAGVTAVGVLGRSRALTVVGLLTAAGQTTYVVGGLRVAQAPMSVYAALARAPLLAAWKVTVQIQVLAGRGPRQWIGTRAQDHRAFTQ